jgi:hypothetical protein
MLGVALLAVKADTMATFFFDPNTPFDLLLEGPIFVSGNDSRNRHGSSAEDILRPEAAGLLIGIECYRVRDSAWMYLTSFVTTRIGVELAAVQGNYPTRM